MRSKIAQSDRHYRELMFNKEANIHDAITNQREQVLATSFVYLNVDVLQLSSDVYDVLTERTTCALLDKRKLEGERKRVLASCIPRLWNGVDRCTGFEAANVYAAGRDVHDPRACRLIGKMQDSWC